MSKTKVDSDLAACREVSEERLCILPGGKRGIIERVFRSRTTDLLTAKVLLDGGGVRYVSLIECNLSGQQ